MALYQKIKALCDEKGISVMELERRCDFPRSSICKWDKNMPSIEKVKEVAEKLEITIDEIIKRGD